MPGADGSAVAGAVRDFVVSTRLARQIAGRTKQICEADYPGRWGAYLMRHHRKDFGFLFGWPIGFIRAVPGRPTIFGMRNRFVTGPFIGIDRYAAAHQQDGRADTARANGVLGRQKGFPYALTNIGMN